MSPKKLIAATLAFLGLLGGCYWLVTPPKPIVWVSQFKLHVEVATPDGVKTGVGFFELTTKSQAFQPLLRLLGWGDPNPSTALSGEAAIITDATSSGPVIIATMLVRDYYTTVEHIAIESFGRKIQQVHSANVGVSAEVRAELYPVLVAFADMRDPRTALELSTPQFERRYGPGYHIRRVRVEKTNQAPLPVLASRFPELIAALPRFNASPLALPGVKYAPHLRDFLKVKE